MVVFYLLFPALFWFIHRGRYGLTKTILFSTCWWTLIEVLCELIPAVVPFRIVLSRLSVFVIGIYFGKLSYQKNRINIRTIVLLLISGYVLFVVLKMPIVKPIADYFYYPVRAMLAISIMATVFLMMEIMERKISGIYSGVQILLTWFGGLTLELYLLHQSYMILFEFPYKITTYLIAAFVLPMITTGLIYIL